MKNNSLLIIGILMVLSIFWFGSSQRTGCQNRKLTSRWVEDRFLGMVIDEHYVIDVTCLDR